VDVGDLAELPDDLRTSLTVHRQDRRQVSGPSRDLGRRYCSEHGRHVMTFGGELVAATGFALMQLGEQVGRPAANVAPVVKRLLTARSTPRKEPGLVPPPPRSACPAAPSMGG
jgi:hypothetical protein